MMKILLAALALVITLVVCRPGAGPRPPEDHPGNTSVAAAVTPTPPEEQPAPLIWSDNHRQRDAHLRERLANLAAHRPGCKCPEHRR